MDMWNKCHGFVKCSIWPVKALLLWKEVRRFPGSHGLGRDVTERQRDVVRKQQQQAKIVDMKNWRNESRCPEWNETASQVNSERETNASECKCSKCQNYYTHWSNITVSPAARWKSNWRPRRSPWGKNTLLIQCSDVASKAERSISAVKDTTKFSCENLFICRRTTKISHRERFRFQSKLNPCLCLCSLRIISSTSAAKFGQISLAAFLRPR